MKTQEFLTLLESNPNKELVFEYEANQFVPKAYHITEIKNKHIESVDCGGFSHTYDETVVQLWISGNEQKEKNMSAEKALKIFNIVDGKKTILRDTPIYFEWGYGDLKTSVYEVNEVTHEADRIVVKMFVPPTVCRPQQLLTTVENLATSAVSCCAPGSKCC